MEEDGENRAPLDSPIGPATNVATVSRGPMTPSALLNTAPATPECFPPRRVDHHPMKWDVGEGGLERTADIAPEEAAVPANAPRSKSLRELPSSVRDHIISYLIGGDLVTTGWMHMHRSVCALSRTCRDFRMQMLGQRVEYLFDEDIYDAGVDMDPLREDIERYRRLVAFRGIFVSSAVFSSFMRSVKLRKAVGCQLKLQFEVSPALVIGALQSFSVTHLEARIAQRETQSSDTTHEAGGNSGDIGGGRGTMQPAFRDGGELTHLVLSEGVDDELLEQVLGYGIKLRSLSMSSTRDLQWLRFSSLSLRHLSLNLIQHLNDAALAQIVSGLPNLTTLSIARCRASQLNFAAPNLESLSISHCRFVSDAAITNFFATAGANPSAVHLKRLELSLMKTLVHPTFQSDVLEEVLLPHCSSLSDDAATDLCQNCTALRSLSLLQSEIINPRLQSATLTRIKLSTCQKLVDEAVTYLFAHCPVLKEVDLAHCCLLEEPVIRHPNLQKIQLSFCVNLKESALEDMFEHSPSLEYVELAVSMFDMGRFTKAKPGCKVVVSFRL